MHKTSAFGLVYVHVSVSVSYGTSECTWYFQPVLIFRPVVLQSLKHDIHGQGENSSQKDVEGHIEEEDEP